MPESIFLEVEENDNAEYMPLMVYEAHEEAVPVSHIMLEDPERPYGQYQVTGYLSLQFL